MVRVFDKTRERRSSNYGRTFAKVEAWRRPGHAEVILVSAGMHALIQPGRTPLTIATKPGCFGYEWTVWAEVR